MLRLSGAAIPGVALVLLPKCPAGLAAWIAVATGVSIPVAAAAQLKSVVAGLCLISLAAVLARVIRVRAGRAYACCLGDEIGTGREACPTEATGNLSLPVGR
jgi:hypothetical protein